MRVDTDQRRKVNDLRGSIVSDIASRRFGFVASPTLRQLWQFFFSSYRTMRMKVCEYASTDAVNNLSI